jgi:hypothetical protein
MAPEVPGSKRGLSGAIDKGSANSVTDRPGSKSVRSLQSRCGVLGSLTANVEP